MPTRLDAIATVTSEDLVKSPFTGRTAAFFHVELLDGEQSLGELMIGDVVVLSAGGDELSVIVRRATMHFATTRPVPTPLSEVPPEAVPFLARSRGRGALAFREHAVASGDRVRVRATVEPSGRGLSVRDDLGPVELDEVLAQP